MVEAAGPSMMEFGLMPENRLPEEKPAFEKGKDYINLQLDNLKASGSFDKWKESFDRGVLNITTESTLKILEVQEILNQTPIGAQIDSIDDVLGIALIFGAVPALNALYKFSKNIMRKAAA